LTVDDDVGCTCVAVCSLEQLSSLGGGPPSYLSPAASPLSRFPLPPPPPPHPPTYHNSYPPLAHPHPGATAAYQTLASPAGARYPAGLSAGPCPCLPGISSTFPGVSHPALVDDASCPSSVLETATSSSSLHDRYVIHTLSAEQDQERTEGEARRPSPQLMHDSPHLAILLCQERPS